MRSLYQILAVCLMLVCLSSYGQSRDQVRVNRTLSSGSYAPYPDVSDIRYTAAPAGYKPFYISHYGRHGSRYLINSKFYDCVLAYLSKADSLGVLTEFGRDFGQKVRKVAEYSQGKYEDLTLLGAKQQQDLAMRMYRNFPEVFRNGGLVDCRSSYVLRCAMSMSNFCMSLKAQNPSLNISMRSNRKDMSYIVPKFNGTKGNDDPAYAELSRYRHSILDGNRLASSLFSSREFISEYVKTDELMNACYETVRSVDCFPEIDVDFDGLFTSDEYVALWEGDSANWYTWNGYYPGSTPEYQVALPILENIINEADEAIAEGGISADLRFGHDSRLGPLTFVMKLDGYCDEITDYNNLVDKWNTSKVIPMAANLQLIFYRHPRKNDILVKILMNEQECRIPVKSDFAPYYNWRDFKEFYSEILK